MISRRFPSSLIAAALAISIASGALAQSGVADAEQQLASIRAQLVTAAPDQRVELIARCDEIYRRLIAAAPADDRVPTWWADRAACALDLAGADGADLSVLYGTPTPQQIQQLRTRALDAVDLLQRAEQSAAQVVARLEAQLVDRSGAMGGTDRAAQTEAALRQLVDVEQLQRIPYLRALARVYIAAASPDRASKENAQSAAKALKELPQAVGPIADTRRVALGAALLHVVTLAPDRASSILSAATDQFEPVASAYRPGADASTLGIALRARLGLLRSCGDPPARPQFQEPLAEREIDLLEAEARAACSLDRAARDAARRSEFVGDAIRTLLTQIDPTRPERKVRIYEKIAQAIPANAPLEKLPAEATFAKAIARVRSSGTGDSIARDDAVALFQRVIDRPDAPAALLADARWEKAVLIAASGNALAELEAVATVFRAEPRSAQALPAAKRVVALFASAQSPSGNLPDTWRTRDGYLREALEQLIAQDIVGAAQWRQELIRHLVNDITRAQQVEGIERALAMFDQLQDPAVREACASPISDALWRSLEVRRAVASDLFERSGVQGAKPEWQKLLPWATRALAWARRNDVPREPAYALIVGEALIGSGDPQGASVLAELAGGPVDHQESTLWSRYRLALGRAHRLAGDQVQAAAVLRELADRLEGAPGASTRDPAFWAAWSELLALMQAQNAHGSRSDDIRLQIKRLELLDARLGGPPYDARLRQIRTQVGE